MSNVLPTNTWDGKIKLPQKNKIPARF